MKEFFQRVLNLLIDTVFAVGGLPLLFFTGVASQMKDPKKVVLYAVGVLLIFDFIGSGRMISLATGHVESLLSNFEGKDGWTKLIALGVICMTYAATKLNKKG